MTDNRKLAERLRVLEGAMHGSVEWRYRAVILEIANELDATGSEQARVDFDAAPKIPPPLHKVAERNKYDGLYQHVQTEIFNLKQQNSALLDSIQKFDSATRRIAYNVGAVCVGGGVGHTADEIIKRIDDIRNQNQRKGPRRKAYDPNWKEVR